MQVYHTPPTPKYVGDTFRKERKKITDVVYSLFSSLLGQSTWQEQLKEGRICVGSEFAGALPWWEWEAKGSLVSTVRM